MFDLYPEHLENVTHNDCAARKDSEYDVRLDGFDLRDKQ